MFDVVVHDDRPWLVMEYLPSQSLAQMLGEKGPLGPTEAADIGRQVADGLAAAHSAGVVHRDVKPGNVLIAEDGRVKLTDFGVSRAVDDVQLTRTGLIAGTPAFLSPEVARGKEPTAASDVFALGATLYATVEGRPPYGLDDNAYALLHKVATDAVPPPVNAGRLTPVIMWLLSADPADRPTATQARDALEAVSSGRTADDAVHGQPTSTMVAAAPVDSGPATVSDTPPARPGPESDRSPVPAGGRNRTRLLAALALLIVGGAAAAVALAWGLGGDPAAPVPPATSTVAAPATTASAPTTTTPPPSTSSTSTTTPEPTSAPPPAGTDPVAFVSSYYALLPGNTDAAFAMLGPAAQERSGGRAGFNGFYGGMQSVSVQNARPSGDNAVSATIVFVRRDGSTSTEAYRFVVGTEGDRTVIESFSRG
jgi:serine/threonine protein kinase